MTGDRRIFKYTAPVEAITVLELPESARLLKVADQIGDGRVLDYWAEVPEAAEPTRERVVRVFGTGHQIRSGELNGFAHFDTVVTAGGALVWHVFLDFNGARVIP